jgi:hypothetical protein
MNLEQKTDKTDKTDTTNHTSTLAASNPNPKPVLDSKKSFPKSPNQEESVGTKMNSKFTSLSKEFENGPKKTRLKADNLNKNSDNLNGNKEKIIRPSRKIEKKGFTKGTWKPNEDKQLISLVSNFGPQNWTRIAEFIPHRSGKQCRERWHNHLNPNINKQKWSIDEDRILIEAHKK